MNLWIIIYMYYSLKKQKREKKNKTDLKPNDLHV